MSATSMNFKLSLDTAANIAVIAAAATFITLSILGHFRWPGSSADEELAQVAGAAQRIEAVEGLTIGDLDQATIKASGTPEVALIEFSDFQCPYCAGHARGTYARIQRDFVDTGQVAYVFFNLPLEALHPLALRASEAAECAGNQGRFWDMHHRLFRSQTALADPDLLSHARAVGLRMNDFETCLSTRTTLPRIRAQMAQAERAGVTSTPTFLIGLIESATTVRVMYRMSGSQPYSAFSRALQDTLASRETLAQ